MNKKLITIFTPVYNRADKITRLYHSLISQSSLDFVWIIVDDGSTDDIDKKVNEFINDNRIEIQYYKQQNQGKHVAHNFGVTCCNTPFFACVDSDDYLLPNAIEEILFFINNHQPYLKSNTVCGILSFRGYNANEKIGAYPTSIEPSSLSELYIEKGMTGDTFLIFKTEIIRGYPFPVFEGERFLRESISYDLIDNQYRYLICNKILYICEYYSDGLTKNSSRLELKSPLGAALFRYSEMKKNQKISAKIRNLSAYVFFSRIGNNTKECKQRLKFLYPFFWFLSFSGYVKYWRIMKEQR